MFHVTSYIEQCRILREAAVVIGSPCVIDCYSATRPSQFGGLPPALRTLTSAKVIVTKPVVDGIDKAVRLMCVVVSGLAVVAPRFRQHQPMPHAAQRRSNNKTGAR
jgi:hypothetical protein